MVYRPNSAKVKNLKTKDYLGKARLIAAADQGNTFTGFAGSEAKKNLPMFDPSKDDRPLDTISFAASNLVKPGLVSRSRLQSEPPVNRNMFPPTPPPDHDQVKPTLALLSNSPPSNPASAPMTRPAIATRANSVRNQPSRPERLDLSRPDLARSDTSKSDNTRSDKTDPSKPDPTKTSPSRFGSNKELPRLGTTRTASEPRGPTRTYSSPRSQRDGHQGRGLLFMETTPRHDHGMEADIDESPEDFYDGYSNPNIFHPDRSSDGHQKQQTTSSHSRRPSKSHNRSRSRHRRHYISEGISENGEDASNTSSLSDFETLNNAGGNLSRPPPTNTRHRSRSRGTSRSRRQKHLELKNIRVKVHSGDDTRYIMVAPALSFEEFVDRVREKFGIRTRFKLKVRDEGDLITMADRDDWDMAVQCVRKEAGNENSEMGKMAVSFPRLHSDLIGF